MNVSTEQAAKHQTDMLRNSFIRFVPLVFTIIAGIICYGLFYNRGAWLSVIGYSVSPAERVLQGEVPYRDFIYNYTPGILWLNALLMRFFGTNLLTVHVGLLVFKIIALVVLYLLSKKVVGSWAALVPVALTLTWIGYKYIFGVFPTQYAMLFLLLALMFMLKYDESNRNLWLLLSGVSVGVVFGFKYNVGILLLGCGAAALFLREFCRTFIRKEFLILAIKNLSLFVAGFVSIAAPMCLYLYSQHAFGAMIDHFLHHASAYSSERAVPLPSLKSLLPVVAGTALAILGALSVSRKWPKLLPVYLITIFVLAATALLIPNRAFIVKNSAIAAMAYLPLLIFAGIEVVSFWQLRGGSRANWWERNGSLAIIALFALGAYLEIYPRADTYHVVRALPPTFLLIVLLLKKCLPVIQSRFLTSAYNPTGSAYLCCAVPIVLLMIIGVMNTWASNFDSHFRLIDRMPLKVERGHSILVPPKHAEFIENLTSLIENNSTSDDYIFSFGQRGAGFYFLTGRRNPTRFVWWRNVGIKKEDREAVLQMLGERTAKLILLQDSLKDNHIREIVNSNYHKVGNASGIAVFDRNL